MNWSSILGRIIGSALLGLEEGTQAVTSPATLPADIATFVEGIIGIWTRAAASGTAPVAVKAAYQEHQAKLAAYVPPEPAAA